MSSLGGPTLRTSSFTLTRWVTLALASGAFAALNGLFAKLFVLRTTYLLSHRRLAKGRKINRTTTEATGSAASSIAHALNLPEGMVEVIVRAVRCPAPYFHQAQIQLRRLTFSGIDMFRPQSPQQLHNVGPVHPRPNRRAIHDQSINYKHIRKLSRNCDTGYDCL